MIKPQRAQKTQKERLVLQFLFRVREAVSVISIILMISSFPSVAQVTITGRVTDGSQNLAGATVRMLTLDSALATGVASDSVGEFVLQHVLPGDYLVTVSMVGFTTSKSNSITITNSDIRLPDVVLEEDATALGEVVIKGERQYLSQKLDRMVIDLQSSITATGNTILEVLAKSPGVVVNKQSNSISMNGRSGVQIMINEKLMQVSSDVAIQMLEGMSASNIEKIELITAPPSKYDANGNAGIIHIVTKRNEDYGTNASFGLTLGARWAETVGGNFTFNKRSRRAAYFFDYAIMRNHNLHILQISRQLPMQDFLHPVNVYGHRENVTTQQNLNMNGEWRLTEATTLNLGITGYSRDWRMRARNNDTEHVAPDSAVTTHMRISQSNIWQSVTGTASIQTKINSKNEITAGIDYLYYENNNPSQYDNILQYEAHTNLDTSKVDLKKNTPIHFLIAKIDYKHTSTPHLSFEGGMKVVKSTLDNDVVVNRRINDTWRLDSLFTSYSTLNENIVAGYLSINWQNPENNWQLNGGLRYEYTRSFIKIKGECQEVTERKYGYLFPTLFFKKDIAEEQDIQFSYARRITRPTYNDIASYASFWSPNTFTAANISLRPAVSDAIRVGYHIRRWFVSLQYAQIRNEITSLQPEVRVPSNALIYRSQNLKDLRTVGLSNSFSTQPATWWEIQGSLTAQYQMARSSHLQYNNQFHLYSLNVNVINILKLPRNYSLEISGMYQSRSRSGITTFLPFGSLNVGVQKSLGTKGVIRIAVDDLLYTNNWRIKTYAPENNLDVYFDYDWHNQFVRVTYSCNLGNTKLKAVRLKSASEEERKRITN
jgi:hypothetical protein